jgi:hypothetical protein
MNKYIMDDDTYIDSISEVISIISILSDFLFQKQKKVIAKRLEYLSDDLKDIVNAYSTVNISHDISISLYIKSRVAMKECIDYLQLINDLGYFDTNELVDKISLLKVQFISQMESSSSDLDVSSIKL